jgi:hypothetical protein
MVVQMMVVYKQTDSYSSLCRCDTRLETVVNSNDASFQLPSYISATGGTVTCCGDYKIHTFTGPGTFTVTCAGNVAGSNTVDYLVL